MFEFTIEKNKILTPLLALTGVVDKRQSLPVLSNILFELNDDSLTLTATDLEIEMTANLECAVLTPSSITIPARKLVDIIRSLDDDSPVTFSNKGNYLNIQSQRSRFRLATLPANDFPKSKVGENLVEMSIDREALLRLFQTTYFAMSQQDVRVYLNGLLLEFSKDSLTSVATDGHRMAIAKVFLTELNQQHRVIIPRKGILEILRLLSSVEDISVDLCVGDGHFTVHTSCYTFMTKLVESRYPAYHKVIPRHLSTFVLVDRDFLKRSLNRITILAHEKTRAIILSLQQTGLCLIANNQQHEEATEELEAQIDGEYFRIGINAVYLLDVLNHLPEGLIRLSFVDADSSILLETLADENYQYVIMPMKL